MRCLGRKTRQFSRGETPLHAPCTQQQRLVGKVGQIVNPMLGHHHGHAAVQQRLDDGAQPSGGHLVEVRRRLVHHHHARAHRQHRRNRHRLLLAARQVEDAAVHQVRDAARSGRFGHASAHLERGNAEVLARERDFGRHVGGEELAARILEHRPHRAGQPLHADGSRLHAAHVHRAVERASLEEMGDQPVQQARRSGFTAPARAQQQHELPAARAQVEAAQRRLAIVGVTNRRTCHHHLVGRHSTFTAHAT